MSTLDLADAGTASIDATVHASPGDVTIDVSLPSPTADMEQQQQQQQQSSKKLKGRHRLLHSLQRMSSTPSLAKIRSNPSSGYRSGYKASVSCISLAGSSTRYSHAYSTSDHSEFSPQYSTAPTSAVGTPCAASTASPYLRPRARTVGRDTTPGTIGLPAELRSTTSMGQCVSSENVDGDYFSRPVARSEPKFKRRPNFNFWEDMPWELRTEILCYLQPKEIVRCSRVAKSWHRACFDGQLWQNLDASAYYRDIPADALVKIMSSAGPFVKDLNLRGCVQLREQWIAKGLADVCRNLENFSLEGCIIDRTSIHCFLLQNSRLVHVNLSGLAGATNSCMKIIAQHCPKIEHLNVTWCNNVDTTGLHKVVEGCPNLKDLRAGEVRGWDNEDFMHSLFKRNKLERLVLANCDTLTDEAFTALLEGVDGTIDYLTGRVIAPSRKLRHLDITRCRGLTEVGVKKLAHTCPNMEGLQLSKCQGLTDAVLCEVLPTMPRLTHLDLEELEDLTNQSLQVLAGAPCQTSLQHLSISYCESLGDAGMLPVLKSCTSLTSLEMDNTRISDLVLIEAAAMVRTRSQLTGQGLQIHEPPTVSMRLIAYDCAHVTWTGVREVLSRNAQATRPTPAAFAAGQMYSTYPREVIQLKCFYNWQPTVEEHTKRVLKGDFVAAARLERKWGDFMIASEEAAGGVGGRRRRRRVREAQMMHADEEDSSVPSGAGIGRRRRARSGPAGCVVM